MKTNQVTGLLTHYGPVRGTGLDREVTSAVPLDGKHKTADAVMEILAKAQPYGGVPAVSAKRKIEWAAHAGRC